MDLLSEPSQVTFLTMQRERYLFGKFTYGKSAVKIWDTNADYSQRVLNMPLLYKMARPVFAVGSRFFPLPNIPKLGDEIRVWQLYDLILDQAGDLNCLLEGVRQAAIENNVDYLVICLNSKDNGYEQIVKKAWIQLNYLLFFLPMTELSLPQEPTYFDVTYL